MAKSVNVSERHGASRRFFAWDIFPARPVASDISLSEGVRGLMPCRSPGSFVDARAIRCARDESLFAN